MPLVEATSGNTGISLSAIGAYLNHPVYIFMPDWVSKERLDLMKLYGANVTLVSKEEGGFKTILFLSGATCTVKFSNGRNCTQIFCFRNNIMSSARLWKCDCTYRVQPRNCR